MVLVKFGMKSTLIRFRDHYYQYKGAAGASANDEDIGLVIDGYKSAFFANLVASYLLKKMENQFIETIIKGIYFDDGLMVFSGIMGKMMLRQWRNKFQQQINIITGGDFLKFTVEIWMPPTINKRTGSTLPCILEEDENDNNEEHITKDEMNAVKVVAKPSFPFLDMQMFWDEEGNLAFEVYRKEGQSLKYLYRQSLHRETVFKSIDKGVLHGE
eukprot:6657029-Ditylum_brightwellii.AAC.1